MKPIKQKKCKVCKRLFTPFSSTSSVCDFECALIHSKQVKDKVLRQDIKELKERLKTNSDYVRELQVIFNKYIRLRDKDKGCVSCGKPLKGKYDAGHYYSTGSYPELRFNEWNVWGQCVYCNQHCHGNLIEYRERLNSLGFSDLLITLDKLKGVPRKYTIPELKELKEFYKQKIKNL